MKTQTIEMLSANPDCNCKSYLLFDPVTKEAAIIDPRFDYVRGYESLLAEHALTLKYSIDTHTHADHLSGASWLRDLTGAKVAMSEHTMAQGVDLKLADGAKITLGDQEITVILTPGHTPDSLCLYDGVRLYTGDSLFIGGTARTDFMGGSSEQLFDSFTRIKELPTDTEVWPGHDYNGNTSSTIAAELAANEAFAMNKDDLVARQAAKAELPLYMSEYLAFNAGGGLTGDQIMKPSDVAALGEIGKDYTLLDVRYDEELAAGRAEGALHIPMPEVRERIGELDDVPTPIVVACRSGVRASLSCMTGKLKDKRWMLLEGGMLGWREAGLPMIADGDATPDVIAPPVSLGGSCAAGGGGGSCAAG